MKPCLLRSRSKARFAVTLLAMGLLIVLEPTVDDPGETIRLLSLDRCRPPIPRRNRKHHHLCHGIARDIEMPRRLSLVHALAAVVEPGIEHGHVSREDVNDGQDMQLLARRRLVMHEIHRPDIIGANAFISATLTCSPRTPHLSRARHLLPVGLCAILCDHFEVLAGDGLNFSIRATSLSQGHTCFLSQSTKALVFGIAVIYQSKAVECLVPSSCLVKHGINHSCTEARTLSSHSDHSG